MSIHQPTKIKKNVLAAWVAWLGIALGALIIAAGLYLHLPQVQNTLFSKLIQHVNHQTQFHIQHKQFRFTWFHKILLEGLEIKDPNDQIVCAIPQLKLHINPFTLLWKKDLTINYIEIKDGKLQLVQGQKEKKFNIQLLLDRLVADDTAASHSIPKTPHITIHKALLNNFSLLLDDQTRPPIGGFDPYHIHLESITAELSKFHYDKDKWVGNLQKFAGYDLTQNLGIQQVQGKFKFTPTVSELQHLYIATESSYLQGDFTLTHEGLASFIHAPHQVHIIAQIDELQLDTQELAPFLPYVQGYDTTYKLKGRIVGKLNDFAVEDFHVAFGQHPSHLGGSAKIQGLPKVDEVSFSVEINQGCLHAEDLLLHIPRQHHTTLQKIKLCNVQGTVAGTLHNLVTKGQFSTGIGQVSTNLAIQIDKATHHIGYQGEITTTDLHVGQLLNLPQLGEVTLHTHIDGQGIDPATANLYVKTSIQKLGFHRYDYQNIHLDGRLANSLFKGNISIEDPHVRSYLATQVNFHGAKKEVLVEGLLSSLAADKLGLTTQSLQASSEINIALQGSTWDELTGHATLQRTHLLFNNKPLDIKELYIAMYKKENGKSLIFNSDLLDIQAEGAPTYTALVHDLQTFVHTYQHSLIGRSELLPPQLKTTYAASYSDEPYTFNYQINLKHINPLLHVLVTEVYVAPNTKLRGTFTKGQEETKLELHVSELDSLQFAHQQLEGIQLDITAHHLKTGASISATSQLKANTHQWEDHMRTDHLLVDINWTNENILFNSTIGDATSDLQYKLAGKAHLQQAGLHINFHDTAIRLSDKVWDLDPMGTIYMSPLEVQCHHMVLSHQDQQIAVEGKWSSVDPEKLTIRASNLLINNFSPFIGNQLDGVIHGTIVITNRPGQPMVQGDIQVHEVTVKDLAIGNLYAKATWDEGTQHMQIACQLKKAEEQLIHIAGLYMPRHPTQNLDLIAVFSHAQLGLLEPFVTPVCSRLQGELHGRFSIKGTLQNPLMKGKAKLENVVLQLKHLKAVYQGYGTIQCVGNTMHVEKLHLSDKQEGYVDFHGKVAYQSLKDITLDLTGKMHQVEILDTQHEDNEYFYGKAIASGNIQLTGPIQHIDIYANATTKKGTSLVIPIRKHNKKAEQEEFIRFVDFKANPTNNLPTSLPSMQLEGINLHINLEITPDAWAKIMFNGKEGDIIEGEGKGNLTIQSDIKGSLHMSGNYELVEGSYNFSVYEVVRKKFKILPGSTITWIDKPYDGILHVKATYEQRTYLTPLVDNLQGKRKEIKDKKKYPIQVGLSLEGVLSAPDIHFDVKFLQLPENPDLQEAITTFQEKTAMDNNYLKNQVFSLVMFKSFSSGNKVRLSNNTLQRSMGELFSQQLSSLAEHLDENLEIDTDIDLADITNTDVDVEEIKQDRTTSVPIKISYNLWDGRLIISRESKINFAAGKEIDFGNMVGDWAIGYGLTDDNRLRIKLQVYPSGAEPNVNMSKSILGAVSFVYVKSFNRWRELFGDKRSKN